jgi:hypothetical protein
VSWLKDLYAAGVTPASFQPDASAGRTTEPDDAPRAEVTLVEGGDLDVHPVTRGRGPAAVCFLDGIQHWSVVGYDGVLPIARAYVAAAVRRRTAAQRELVTLDWEARDLVVAPVGAMRPEPRRAVETVPDLVPLPEDSIGTPAVMLEALRREVHRARLALERTLGERTLERLGNREWLVVDGQLAVSARLARHPRALGVIKSHGAQFLEGRRLERALTVPAEHRTSVFRVHGGHGRTEVDSWYLRLWPWAGNDLLYGLIRIEARAHDDTVASAAETSAWVLGERSPLAAPDARWDRLLYPIHLVEEYLRARMPGDFRAAPVTRLPRTGT